MENNLCQRCHEKMHVRITQAYTENCRMQDFYILYCAQCGAGPTEGFRNMTELLQT